MCAAKLTYAVRSKCHGNNLESNDRRDFKRSADLCFISWHTCVELNFYIFRWWKKKYRNQGEFDDLSGKSFTHSRLSSRRFRR